MNRAIKKYNGSKAGNGTFQNIINNIPKCEVFVDCFAGSGTFAAKLLLPKLTILNDIDPSVIAKYNYNEPGIIVRNNCYSSIIEEFDNKEGVFFYCDPPYLFSTRRGTKKLYNYEFTNEQHVRFLSMAITVKNNCMISHYPCELYDSYLKDWRTFDFESNTHKGLRVERIYMNYEPPTILQDYRYLGKDFIERQQLKRKTERLLKKLEKLPELERTALLSAVIGKYNYTSATILNNYSGKHSQ